MKEKTCFQAADFCGCKKAKGTSSSEFPLYFKYRSWLILSFPPTRLLQEFRFRGNVPYCSFIKKENKKNKLVKKVYLSVGKIWGCVYGSFTAYKIQETKIWRMY